MKFHTHLASSYDPIDLSTTLLNIHATNRSHFLQEFDLREPIFACDELENMICAIVLGDNEEQCCFVEWLTGFQDLPVCYLKTTTGEDRFDCKVRWCPEAIPIDQASNQHLSMFKDQICFAGSIAVVFVLLSLWCLPFLGSLYIIHMG